MSHHIGIDNKTATTTPPPGGTNGERQGDGERLGVKSRVPITMARGRYPQPGRLVKGGLGGAAGGQGRGSAGFDTRRSVGFHAILTSVFANVQPSPVSSRKTVQNR